jgi:hypothetical protein
MDLTKTVVLASILTMLIVPVWGRPSGSTLSVPVFKDAGGHREPISIEVSNEIAVSPFDVTTSTMLDKRLRFLEIVNESTCCVLMISTMSGFSVEDKHWPVPSNFGRWETYNYEKFWLRYREGQSTTTVRGHIETE